MYHPEALDPIVTFVRELGIEVVYGPGAHNGFLPGINIHAGAIHIDPDTLVGSGDILHEAGHIIVLPRRYWSRLGTDLQHDIDALVTEEESGPDNAAPAELVRAARQGEFMSQAWCYAVALHLGLSPGCVFFPGSHRQSNYEGTHPMQLWLERGTHFGPMALADAGMTGYAGLFSQMGNNGLAPFPHMTRWTLD